MSEPIHLERVSSAHCAHAVQLICGSHRELDSAGRYHMMLRLIHERPPGDVHLWWARQRRRPLAAALVLASPGRAGMVFYSAPTESNADILVRVVKAAGQAAISAGLTFVQALLGAPAQTEINVLLRAGFLRLAELIYMRRELTPPELAPQAGQNDYLWRAHGDFDDRELASVIGETYRQSLDCPALAGARRLEDIIQTHRSCGVFTPESWWILQKDGQHAGCVLVNDYPTNLVSDVVYLGVTAPFRGRGLARVMLRRAGRQAIERGYPAMTLAVDSANHYALRAYEAEGFFETGRRLAYAMLAGKNAS